MQTFGNVDVTFDLNGSTPLISSTSSFGVPLDVNSGGSLTITNGTFDANQGNNGKTFVVDGSLVWSQVQGRFWPRTSRPTELTTIESGGVINSPGRTLSGTGRLEINGGFASGNFINFSDGSVQAFELNNTDYSTQRLDLGFGTASGLGDLEVSLAPGFITTIGEQFQLAGGGNFTAGLSTTLKTATPSPWVDSPSSTTSSTPATT